MNYTAGNFTDSVINKQLTKLRQNEEKKTKKNGRNKKSLLQGKLLFARIAEQPAQVRYATTLCKTSFHPKLLSTVSMVK